MYCLQSQNRCDAAGEITLENVKFVLTAISSLSGTTGYGQERVD